MTGAGLEHVPHRGGGLVGLFGGELCEAVEVEHVGIFRCQTPGIDGVGSGEGGLSSVEVDQRGGLVEAGILRPGIDQIPGEGAGIFGTVF